MWAGQALMGSPTIQDGLCSRCSARPLCWRLILLFIDILLCKGHARSMCMTVLEGRGRCTVRSVIEMLLSAIDNAAQNRTAPSDALTFLRAADFCLLLCC